MTTATDPKAPAPKHASAMTRAEYRAARAAIAGGDMSVLTAPGRAPGESQNAMQMTPAEYREARMAIRMGRAPAAKKEGVA